MTILCKVMERVDENKILVSDMVGQITCTCNNEELFLFAEVRIKLITGTSFPQGRLIPEADEIKDALLWRGRFNIRLNLKI